MSMPLVAAIPAITVEIAFSPTDIRSLTQTWTDVTLYVRDFSTHGGRQHFLDRIEASVLGITLDNRNGYFWNGTLNGTNYRIRTRLPIRVRATWSGVTYGIFNGVIDSVEIRTQDQLNSDLVVNATDLLKFLSLRTLSNPDLYASVADVASTRSWYHSTKGFTYLDSVGSYNGKILGPYALTDGVALYDDTKQALDVTNGTQSTNTADVRLPVGYGTGFGIDAGIDFWIIGQELANQTLLPLSIQGGFFAADTTLAVDEMGRVYTPTTYSGSTLILQGLQSTIPINDGQWHHVAYVIDSTTGDLALIVDGVAVRDTSSSFSSLYFLGSNANYQLVNTALCYVDQVVIQNAGSATASDAIDRYAAGALLRNRQLSGDRVAEILTIAGFGAITGGKAIPYNYRIDGSTYVPGDSGNGDFWIHEESSSVTGNTALGMIGTVSETEVGVFYQNDDGVFDFHTRSYPYSNTKSNTSQGTLGDNQAATYHYEGQSFQETYDDVDVWTSVSVTPAYGVVETYQATTENLYGPSTLQKSGTLDDSQAAALATAQYLGYVFKSPLARVGNVELRSTMNNGAALPLMLGISIQDRVTIQRQHNNGVGLDTDMLIESTNHEFAADPGVWRTMFVLDPFPIRNETQDGWYFFQLDSATNGLLDGSCGLL